MTVAFITLTNQGYLPYTFNCYKSLEKVGITNLKCFTIGRVAYRRISRKKYAAEYIYDEENTGFQKFRQGNWAEVTFHKFEAIYESLRRNEFVCFTDGDIVFKKANVLDYCREMIGERDLLVQNDGLVDRADQDLCSGFLFIRSNETTRKLFNPAYVRQAADIREGWDDQVYLNTIKCQLNFAFLPLALFPNGQYFFDHHRKLDPLLIHFNWVIGHAKLVKFIKFKECYSPALWFLYFRLALKNYWSKWFG